MTKPQQTGDHWTIPEELRLVSIQETLEAHDERIAKARQRYPDWDEVASSPEAHSMILAPAVDRAIREMENGADVLYFLAKHPEAFWKMDRMAPLERLGEE